MRERKQAYPEALTHPLFRVVSNCAQALGQPVYVVGGYVRDFVLGKAVKDIDFVTLGSGVQLAQKVAEALTHTKLATYDNFGTALVVVEDYELEFVGARRESYRKDSRKPIVEDGTLEDDQLRRDFTINTLSLSLNEPNYGQLVDPFDGLRDLAEGIIRTPRDPNLTFSDDPLRMLRAIRFACRLGYYIEPEAYKAIYQQRERIQILSQERITDEVNKILLCDKPSIGLYHLEKTGLLPYILPELEAMKGVEEVAGQRHKDNFHHTLKVVDNLAALSPKLWLRWAALLHDIAKPLTKRFEPGTGWTFHGHEDKGARIVPHIFRRLKLPQGEAMRYVRNMVQLHQRPIALVNEQVTDAAMRRLVVDAGEDLADLMLLCRADITTRDENRKNRYQRNFRKVEERIMEVLENDRLRNWQPPITGEQIIQAYQLKPGPAVGLIKNAIREAILEGEIPNEEQAAFAYMQQIAPALIEQAEQLGR